MTELLAKLLLILLLAVGLSTELVTTSGVEQITGCPQGMVAVPGTDGLCTHGPDPAPPGKDEDRAVRLVREVRAERETVDVPCADDGLSGPRVQVLYVRDAVAVSRYAASLSNIVLWTSQVDAIYAENAVATGGVRHVRWLHGAACTPIITEVVLPAGAILGFGTTISALVTQGYNRSDRDYLMFADTTAAGICGIGTLSSDDRPGQDNWNNDGSAYARVDAGCWGAATAAHELTHNLGAVQDSAPNSSGGNHCTDDYDIMCYSDSPNHPTMRIICPDNAGESHTLDCKHDDFFNAVPAPGSYLDTHWNTANNRFLIASEPATPTPIPPTATSVPTATAVPPTQTPIPLTATIVPPQPTPTATPTSSDHPCRHLERQQRKDCRRARR